ncbi:exopolyphosphatase [Malassezia vespertilionis]|uniref:Ppx1p n=1 Tax=Malassezia vespertilionis TaxID=2020962 RepID=A0A2N1J724_9BASI|nr:exopolyphosphatase [Malassezia vespertilionis]PKI82349.1 Ppx1p [Malassezia vespertilionis]WFD08122.1 exopolyphosphatase [Malassezia vespertilionis]
MPPPPTLPAYVQWAKQQTMEHLRASKHGKTPNKHLLIVMGNDAGDLDSAASAMGLSYLLAHDAKLRAKYHLGDDANVVPLLQTPRDDLEDRSENVLVYDMLGISREDILCIDDLGVSIHHSTYLSPEQNVSLGLVDHPLLTPAWGGAKEDPHERQVDVIVDHHEEQGAHLDAKLRIIRSPSNDPVGSTASLVSNLFHDSGNTPPHALADLLLSAIVLDTKNVVMLPKGKASAVDLAAYKFLLPHSSFKTATSAASFVSEAQERLSNLANAAGVVYDTSTHATKHETTAVWSKLLRQVKANVAHLDTHGLLARDMKIADVHTSQGKVRFGISSVPLSLSAWLSGAYRQHAKPHDTTDAAVEQEWRRCWVTMHAWMQERGLDIAVVLPSFKEMHNGKLKSRRDFAMLYAAPQGGKAFADVLAELEAWGKPGSLAPSATFLDLRPWRGQRLIRGERERVHGLGADGQVQIPTAAPIYGTVLRQGNTNANRKVVQPALVRILKYIL